MRFFRFCIVGKKRNGRRVVVWRGVFKLLLLSWLVGVPAATGVYLLVVQRWNPLAPLAGLAAGLASTLLAILFNLFTPKRSLPTVGSPWSGSKL
jgi:hypothetical protein